MTLISPIFRLFLCLAALALLCGCSLSLDADQVRVCRQTLPAVNPDASAIMVMDVEEGIRPYAVMIDYRVTENGVTRARSVRCGFAAEGLSLSRSVVDAFATEDGTYSPMKVHILNRFWLANTTAVAQADPGPGESVMKPIPVSKGEAYLIQSLVNGLPTTAMTMLIAVAYALIYGLIGRINLAFGEIAVLGSYGMVIGSLVATQAGVTSIVTGLLFSAAVGVAVAILYGRVIERLVFSPLAFGPGQSILVATIALAIVMQDYLRLAQGAQTRWIPPVWTTPYAIAGSATFVADITAMQILITVVAVALALGLIAVMRWSEFGRQWRAMADDPKMANLMGIASGRILAQTFGIATAFAGMGGVIMTAYYGGAGFAAGTMVGLKALVAAVVGGIGSVGGALLGGLAIGLFEAFWSAYLPIEQRDLAVLLLLVVIFVLRPGGLFGLADNRPRHI